MCFHHGEHDLPNITSSITYYARLDAGRNCYNFPGGAVWERFTNRREADRAYQRFVDEGLLVNDTTLARDNATVAHNTGPVRHSRSTSSLRSHPYPGGASPVEPDSSSAMRGQATLAAYIRRYDADVADALGVGSGSSSGSGSGANTPGSGAPSPAIRPSGLRTSIFPLTSERQPGSHTSAGAPGSAPSGRTPGTHTAPGRTVGARAPGGQSPHTSNLTTQISGALNLLDTSNGGTSQPSTDVVWRVRDQGRVIANVRDPNTQKVLPPSKDSFPPQLANYLVYHGVSLRDMKMLLYQHNATATEKDFARGCQKNGWALFEAVYVYKLWNIPKPNPNPPK